MSEDETQVQTPEVDTTVELDPTENTEAETDEDDSEGSQDPETTQE